MLATEHYITCMELAYTRALDGARQSGEIPRPLGVLQQHPTFIFVYTVDNRQVDKCIPQHDYLCML